MKKENLIPITVRVPKRDIKNLLKAHPEILTQSELMRILLEQELERVKSWQAHHEISGTLGAHDIE